MRRPWGYGYDPTSGDYQSLGRGALPASSVDPTPGADNFLALTVYQGVAILSGNTFSAAAVIPMQAPAVIGDVKAEVGFVSTSAGITAAPLPMSLSNFAVWDLSSGMAPVQGEPTPQPTLIPATAALPTTAPVPTTAPLPTAAAIPTTTPVTANAPVFPPVQASSGVLGGVFQHARGVATALPPIASAMSGAFIQLQDQYNWAPASASLADFYTIVTFVNPADLSTPSDIGIGFRASQEPETGWRFVLQSSGQWYLMQPGQQATASGTAASFVATPGASNTIELLAQGGTGLIAVNGLVLGSLDLTAVPGAGDIYVGSGFFQGDTVPGRQVAYQDWWIYPMSILDVKSG